MNTSQNIGKIARYTVAIYLLAAILYASINEAIKLFFPHASSISALSSIISLFWIIAHIYIIYVLFKNLRNHFAGVVGIFLFLSVILIPVNLSQKADLIFFAPLLLFALSIILILISWKMESGETKTRVGKAREIFGEHIKDIPDEEVHKLLK